MSKYANGIQKRYMVRMPVKYNSVFQIPKPRQIVQDKAHDNLRGEKNLSQLATITNFPSTCSFKISKLPYPEC